MACHRDCSNQTHARVGTGQHLEKILAQSLGLGDSVGDAGWCGALGPAVTSVKDR